MIKYLGILVLFSTHVFAQEKGYCPPSHTCIRVERGENDLVCYCVVNDRYCSSRYRAPSEHFDRWEFLPQHDDCY